MKILGYDYEFEKNVNDHTGSYGWFDAKSLTIQIADNLNKQQKESTILHEILEALSYHLMLEIGNNIIMPLEAGLYQVLTDAGVDLSPLSLEFEKILEE